MRHRAPGRRTAPLAVALHSFMAPKKPSPRLPRLLGGLLAWALLGGCAETPEEARFKLGELGYEYNPHTMFVATAENDVVAVDLLIRAGMDPNELLYYRGLIQLGHRGPWHA